MKTTLQAPARRSGALSSVLALTLASLSASVSSAQLAESVVDLRPGEGFSSGVFLRSEFVSLGDRVVFLSGSTREYQELWVTEGTPETTRTLARITGPFVGRAGEIAFFANSRRDRPGITTDLWRTDGTAAGTFPVGFGFNVLADNLQAAAVDDVLLFTGIDHHLWRSDGTGEGTELLGPDLDLGYVQALTPMEGGMLVLASNSLWFSDGTVGGTRQIVPSYDNLTFDPPVPSGSRIYFREEIEGLPLVYHRLWVLESLDSTPVSLLPGRSDLNIEGMVPGLAGELLFMTRDANQRRQLWASNGTVSSTRPLVTDLQMNPPHSSGESWVWRDAEGLWFVASDQDGRALYRLSDGVRSRIFPPLCLPGECTLLDPNPPRFGDYFFLTTPREAGSPAWISDGTAAGTRPIRDFCGEICRDFLGNSVAVGEILFLSARDVDDRTQLWTTDGTTAGTHKRSPLAEELQGGVLPVPEEASFGWIMNLSAAPGGRGPWAVPKSGPGLAVRLAAVSGVAADPSLAELQARGSDLLFSVFIPGLDDFGPAGVYRLGDDGNPSPLADLGSSNSVRIFTGGEVSLASRRLNSGDHELIALHTTPETAETLVTLDTPPTNAVAWQGKALFTVAEGEGAGLWATDGTPAGTGRVFHPVARGLTAFSSVRATDADLLFLASGNDNEPTLFTSDGTEEGTASLGSIGSAFLRTMGLGQPVTIEGDTYVLTCTFETQGGFFRVTGAGLERLPADPVPMPCSTDTSQMNPLLVLGDQLILFSGDRGSAAVLWAFDPATSTLTSLHQGLPLLSGSGVVEAVRVADRVLFRLGQEATGQELWSTDGTAAGTGLVRDIQPGPGSSFPQELIAAGDLLFFNADNVAHGRELWASDGTEAGTRLVHDIFPGAQSSDPQQLTIIGDRLYFVADDGLIGRELWVLPLNDPGPACKASEEALCLKGDRFKVEARWRDFKNREGTGKAVELTGDTGYFWFFNDQNVESVLKVLDGRGLNEHFWTFFGALSNVEYHLTVTDAQTGLTRRYFNPAGNFSSVGDTRSFGPLGASLQWSPDPESFQAGTLPEVSHYQVDPARLGGSCAPSSERLCLNGGRFAVETSWTDFQGVSGTGQAVDLTDDTGTFWFFRDTNVELVLKVLDGRASNGNYWVFYGSLSNVDFDITVTDTETGQVRVYRNRSRAFASVGDTRAFPPL